MPRFRCVLQRDKGFAVEGSQMIKLKRPWSSVKQAPHPERVVTSAVDDDLHASQAAIQDITNLIGIGAVCQVTLRYSMHLLRSNAPSISSPPMRTGSYERAELHNDVARRTDYKCHLDRVPCFLEGAGFKVERRNECACHGITIPRSTQHIKRNNDNRLTA